MLSLAANFALCSAFKLKAERSVSAGAESAGVCAGTGAASDWTAAGVASLSEASRAFCTASTVAPSRTTPRSARRNGREIAIATGIGSPAGRV
jgi:hypothetical protein